MNKPKMLIIAEKPSVGAAIASQVWPEDYKSRKVGNDHYTDGSTTISWASGHILRVGLPNEYDSSWRSWSAYQMFPGFSDWLLFPKESPNGVLRKRIEFFRKVSGQVDVVVNAGDPDREGQLLIDEILEYIGYKGPVQRLLLTATDPTSVKRALGSMFDNKKNYNLFLAGKARTMVDWYVGYNLTRVYTVTTSQNFNWRETVSIGRVMTPTAALVYNREQEIKQFHPVKHYSLEGIFCSPDLPDMPFTADYQLSNDLPLDADGHCANKDILEMVRNVLLAGCWVLQDIQYKECLEKPPAPYNLAAIQAEANAKYGYSPKETEDVLEALYTAQLMSYPRCQYKHYPETQLGDAEATIKMLEQYGIAAAKDANPSIRSDAWQSGEGTNHSALMPTTTLPPDNMTEIQKNIYRMVALRYLAQFYPPYKYQQVTYTITACKEFFKGKAISPIELGFKVLSKGSKEEKSGEEEQKIPPNLVPGQSLTMRECNIVESVTKSPKRFTEGTLLSAMANIYKFMDPKSPHIKKIREIDGIGTPATRSSIIDKLLGREKKYDGPPLLLKEGKFLKPSDFCERLMKSVHSSLISPDMTAQMEIGLADIEEGTLDVNEYLASFRKFILDNVTYAQKAPFPFNGTKITCPVCNHGFLKHYFNFKNRSHFYVCSDKDCRAPGTGRPFTCPEDPKTRSPFLEFCPSCKNVLSRIPRKAGGYFWKCETCKKTWADDHGPVFFVTKPATNKSNR